MQRLTNKLDVPKEDQITIVDRALRGLAEVIRLKEVDRKPICLIIVNHPFYLSWIIILLALALTLALALALTLALALALTLALALDLALTFTLTLTQALAF